MNNRFWVVRDVKATTTDLREIFSRESTVPYLREVAGAGLARVEAEHHQIHTTEAFALADLVARLERARDSADRLLHEALGMLAATDQYSVFCRNLPAGEEDREHGPKPYAEAVQLAEHLHAERNIPHVVTLKRTAEVVYTSKGSPD